MPKIAIEEKTKSTIWISGRTDSETKRKFKMACVKNGFTQDDVVDQLAKFYIKNGLPKI